MFRTVPKVAAAAAGLVVLAGALTGGIVLAEGNQTPTPTPTSRAADAKAHSEEFLQKLATNLGIDVQKLKDALKTTSLEEVDAALAAGKIDQATADRMKQAIENGDTFGLMGPGFGAIGGPRGGAMGIRFGLGANHEAVATFLGIDQQTLQDALQSGKTLVQVAAEHGKSREQLKEFLATEAKTHLDEAVTSGKITQAQADTALKTFTDSLDKLIDGQMPAKGPGGIDGPRRMNGNRPNFAPGGTTQQNSQPAGF